MAYIRKYQKENGRTEVQVCWKRAGKVYKTVQVGTAVSEKGIERLEKQARAIIDEGKRSLFDLSEYDTE